MTGFVTLFSDASAIGPRDSFASFLRMVFYFGR
jgi:hypothetical protein